MRLKSTGEELNLFPEVDKGFVALKGHTNSPRLFLALIEQIPSVQGVSGVNGVTLHGVRRL